MKNTLFKAIGIILVIGAIGVQTISCSSEFERIDFLAPGEGGISSVRGSSSSRALSSSSSAIPSSSSVAPSITYGSLYDSRDGKTYKTVVIGSQTWMAENLNYNASGSVCYGNNTSNCDTYGRLYNWNTAMAACPSGWHLPSDAEWTALTDFAGGVSTAGWHLKSASGWSSGGNGQDTYGFAALPGGGGLSDGTFFADEYNRWWSATE